MIEISVPDYVYWTYVIFACIGTTKVVDWIFIIIDKFANQEKSD